MARRRRKSSMRRVALIVVVLGAVACALWLGPRLFERWRRPAAPQSELANVSADRVDPALDGRRVRVSGKLSAGKSARDLQLGVAADAPVLFRHVEMYQWREHCERGDCRYANTWSALPIDSSKFRVPAGHENPPAPFADAYFGGDIHLGAFAVDVDLAAAQAAAVDYPVHAAALPPNLAATFREIDGALYAGGDPAKPQVGELRVSYRIVPTGAVVNLTGVQRGTKLVAN
jgi:hypothetical protein